MVVFYDPQQIDFEENVVYEGRRGDEEHTESDVGGISGEDRGHRTHQVGVGLARTAGDCWLPNLLVCARRDRHHHSHFTTVLPGNARPGLYYMLLTVWCHMQILLIYLVALATTTLKLTFSYHSRSCTSYSFLASIEID